MTASPVWAGLREKSKKRVWIREGDILIVTPWSFQDEKCDIIYRYLPFRQTGYERTGTSENLFF